MTERQKEQLVDLLIERIEQLDDKELAEFLLEIEVIGRLAGEVTLSEVALSEVARVLGRAAIAPMLPN